jgi:AmmeMemoRadiSam system protein B
VPSIRLPAVAGLFYPAEPASLRARVEALLESARSASLAGVLGGLVPHAGLDYSGSIAAAFYASVSDAPESVVFLASAHRATVRRAAVSGAAAWRTPLGDVAVDAALAREIVERSEGAASVDDAAHAGDHAVEVELPFVQILWKGAGIVPMVVPAHPGSPSLGTAVAAAVAGTGRRALVVASSDLTHYGRRFGFAPWGEGVAALRRAHGGNDARLLALVERLDAEGALKDAARNASACGGGAIAAAIAAARARGARRGVLLAKGASYEAEATPAPLSSVGYAAVAFVP